MQGVLLQFLECMENNFVTSVSNVPSTRDFWGSALPASLALQLLEVAAVLMKADLAKLAHKMLRTPKCSRCRNHGFLVAVKGHAGNCRWKQCTCDKCFLITERQKIMAEQKMLRKQASDEDQELASRAEAVAPASSLPPLPPPASSGDLEPGPEDRAATYLQERTPHGPSPGPSAFQPVLAGGGHTGAGEQAAVAIPGFGGPQVAAEAAGTGGSGHMEMRRPLRPIPSSSFAFGKTPRLHAAFLGHCFLPGLQPPCTPCWHPWMGLWGGGGENAF